MTSLLIRILFIILAVWLLRRLLMLFLGNNKTQKPRKHSESGKNMVKDPVCGMYMDPKLAIKHELKNGTFYFCSEKCRDKFLNTPPGEEPGKPSTRE